VKGDALYFSRSPLPFVRNAQPATLHKRHLGIYGFRRDFLFEFVTWPPSMLELTESLEQLRAMENGTRLRVVMTEDLSPGVDTEEQARAVESLLAAK
jgi:3-deoxy-manno-octulosonate cytidylyltransferase (CMP-KDO synthetase)